MSKISEYIPPHPWWQVGNDSTLRQQLLSMSDEQVLALRQEIKGAITSTQAQLTGDRPGRWREDAKRAMSHMVRRLSIVKLELTDLADNQGGQPFRRLIQEEQPAVGEERPADGEHLLLPARQRPARLVRPIAEPREHLEDPL